MVPAIAGVTKPLKNLGQYSIFIEELKIYNSLVHPGVVQTYGGFIRENDHCGVFITELAAGNLTSYKEKASDPGMSVKLEMISQLIDALEYIHEKGLVHGDLKSSNVLTFFPSTTDITSQTHLPLLPDEPTTIPTTKVEDLSATKLSTAMSTDVLSPPTYLSQDLSTSSLAIPTLPPSHYKSTPVLKIIDFSTMAPVPFKYDSPSVPILHAEGYHSQRTLFVRPPESMDKEAPMPSVDIYGFGFVVAEILFWKSPNYIKEEIFKELEERFKAELGMIIHGMLKDKVENRWDLERVQKSFIDYKLKYVI